MKTILKYTLVALLTVACGACQEEELSSESVIIDSNTASTPFDGWILENYTKPYNIDLIYRANNREYPIEYTLAPPKYGHAVGVAKILQHLWLGTYNDLKGTTFTKTYIPKVIILVGSGMYNSGSVTVGEAEGGVKITFARINDLDLENLTLATLTGGTVYTGTGTESSGMIKTAFHEFAHILTQTKPLPETFSLITPNAYVGEDWNANGTTPQAAWTTGFATKYSKHSPSEDFAEIVSVYTTRGAANWDQLLVSAGATGAAIINLKTQAINRYLQTSWNTNLDAMRKAFEARAATLNEVDLVTL